MRATKEYGFRWEGVLYRPCMCQFGGGGHKQNSFWWEGALQISYAQLSVLAITKPFNARGSLSSQFTRIKFHWNCCSYRMTQWQKLILIYRCCKNHRKNQFSGSDFKVRPWMHCDSMWVSTWWIHYKVKSCQQWDNQLRLSIMHNVSDPWLPEMIRNTCFWGHYTLFYCLSHLPLTLKHDKTSWMLKFDILHFLL